MVNGEVKTEELLFQFFWSITIVSLELRFPRFGPVVGRFAVVFL
jgi:hypothetical protein